ncbi:hypothetical protein OPU39_05475, partial [Acinetobacter nosocomialis]|nr:hypothetical protein [Acinetobacter nosocomialis]
MISLPLVYTILALIAYTTSFWYLFIRLMSKREPNPWLFALVTTLALLLHGTVLCSLPTGLFNGKIMAIQFKQ